MRIETRESWGDLIVTAETRYGVVNFMVTEGERAVLNVSAVINARARNAERTLRDRRTDAEWLEETVNADG